MPLHGWNVMRPFDLAEVEHLDTKHLIYRHVPVHDIAGWLKLLEWIKAGRICRP